MATVNVKASLREERGKNAMNRLRAVGKLPGVVYGQHEKGFSITMNTHDFTQTVRPGRGGVTLVNLEIEGKEDMLTVIKEVQRAPVRGDLIHVDLQHIHPGEPLEIDVPILLHGTAPGVKEGGVLEQVSRSVRVKCLPKDIPDHITVDVSKMKILDSIHVADLDLKGITILNPAESVIVTILTSRALVSAATLEEELLEAEEGVPTAADEVPEIGEEEVPEGAEEEE